MRKNHHVFQWERNAIHLNGDLCAPSSLHALARLSHCIRYVLILCFDFDANKMTLINLTNVIASLCDYLNIDLIH